MNKSHPLFVGTFLLNISTTAVCEITDYGPYTKHFWPCVETGAISGLTDVVGNNGLPSDNNRTYEQGDAHTVRALSWGAASFSFPFYNSEDKDTLVFFVGKARKDAAHPDPNNGGNISFYYGNNTKLHIRVQPYYAVFSDNTLGSFYDTTIQTPFYDTNQYRSDGQIYALGGLKRGDDLEHYADGLKTGSVAIATKPALINAWNTFQPSQNMLFGHSGWGPLAACIQLAIDAGLCETAGEPITSGFPEGVSNFAQDYYGFAVFVFENGAPPESEINDAMNWMKAEWQVGNKEIYPLWRDPGASPDGDLAPLGHPDGDINIADYLVGLRIVMGLLTPNTLEITHGDLYPVGMPDGKIDISDLMLLLQKIHATL